MCSIIFKVSKFLFYSLYHPLVSDSLKGSQEEELSSSSSDMRRVLLTNAREALSKYLITEREKRLVRLGQKDTLCEVIDTCLLKVYMSQKDDASIYRLLQQPNDCNVEDCSKVLHKSKVSIHKEINENERGMLILLFRNTMPFQLCMNQSICMKKRWIYGQSNCIGYVYKEKIY